MNLYVLHLFIGRIRVLHFSFHLTFPTLHSCMLPQLQSWLKNKHRAHMQALTWFHTDPIKSTIGLMRIKAWNSSHLFKRRLNFWRRRFFVRIYGSLPRAIWTVFSASPILIFDCNRSNNFRKTLNTHHAKYTEWPFHDLPEEDVWCIEVHSQWQQQEVPWYGFFFYLDCLCLTPG